MVPRADHDNFKPVSMAVVGYGHFGRLHAEKVARSELADLVAVSDIDAEAAADAQAALGVEVVEDYRDLLGRVDAVSIVVPTQGHYEIAEAFLEHGSDVLVEKPLTSDPATARRLVDVADAEKRILQVGHLERFTRAAEILRAVLRRPLFVDSVRIAPFGPRGTDVNVIHDLMIHDLDLVLSLVDSPIRSVEAAGTPVFSSSEDIANARITFASGCVARLVASRISLKKERKMRIFEADCYTAVDFIARTVRTISNPTGHPPGSLADVDVVTDSYADEDPLQREIDAFAHAVSHRTPPMVSGAEGLRALEAAERVNRSMKSHAAFVEQADADRTKVKGAA